MDFVESSGQNPFDRWLHGFAEDVQAKINERLAFMEGLAKWPEKWASDYKGAKGICEIRIVHRNINYRPLFMYAAQRRVIVLLGGAIEQNGMLPRSEIEAVVRRRKEFLKDQNRAVRHQF